MICGGAPDDKRFHPRLTRPIRIPGETCLLALIGYFRAGPTRGSAAAYPTRQTMTPVHSSNQPKPDNRQTTAPLDEQASEQRLARLADAMPHVVWRAQPDGTVTYYNHRVAEFAGAVRMADGTWQWQGILHPDDVQPTIEAWEAALQSGSVYEKEHRVAMRDGSYQWHLSRGMPDRDENGAILQWVGTATNIDAQKRAQQALYESEEQFRTLAETLPHLVWMTDAQGNRIFASGRWLEYTGFPPSAEAWAVIVHPDDQAGLHQAWETSLRTGQSYQIEARLRSRHGEYRWHAVHGEPLRDEAGTITKWIGAYTDIHAQKMLNEQLEQLVAERTEALRRSNQALAEKNAQLQLANRERESFNYVASHDLQEPLRKIQTFINLFQQGKGDEAARAGYLNRIIAAAQRMSNLIQAILDYSRTANADAVRVPTDLSTTLQQVVSDFELVLQERQAEVTSDPLPTIPAVPPQIGQLFSNLIGNALKFSNRPPRIHVTARQGTGADLGLPPEVADRAFVQLDFRDNGIGFDPQYAQKIFTLFQRLHPRDVYPGTGIGLTICKRIVDNHQGYIRADGRPGEGAVFTVFLPVENYQIV